MMGSRKYIFGIIFLLTNCTTSLEKKMDGIWKIEEINFKNENYKDKLYINVIAFGDNSIDIPETHDYAGNNAYYEIISQDEVDSLIIRSHNKVFDGKYKLLFAQDSEDGSIYAKLISNETFIIIHKANLGLGLD